MCFLGNPGTGKTAVAQLVAEALSAMGVLRRGHLVVGKKADLLGRYSNHVARNTRAVVRSALGGVLLIDEAYSLLQGEAELGRECINVLVDMCYEYKEDLVVILAGYTDMMADFFAANAGLASRFPHKFAFPDYDVDELEQIARMMIRAASFELSNDAESPDALRALIEPVPREVPCGNARSVENRITAAIAAQSGRLSSCYGGDTPFDERMGRQTENSESDDARLFQLTAPDLKAAAIMAEKAAAALCTSAPSLNVFPKWHGDSAGR